MQQLERDFEQEQQDLNAKYGPEKPRPHPMSSVSLSGYSGTKFVAESNPRLFGTFPHLRIGADSQSAPSSPTGSPITIPRVTLSKSAHRDSASIRQSCEDVPRGSKKWN